MTFPQKQDGQNTIMVGGTVIFDWRHD
jgi:hypothetical protein